MRLVGCSCWVLSDCYSCSVVLSWYGDETKRCETRYDKKCTHVKSGNIQLSMRIKHDCSPNGNQQAKELFQAIVLPIQPQSLFVSHMAMLLCRHLNCCSSTYKRKC